MPRLASRLSAVQPSATIAISDRAAAMRAEGIDVISFGLGEPDFETPTHVREAGKRAIDQGHTRYTRVRGVSELLAAIADDSLRRRGVGFSPSEIVVSVGAKHALFNLALALYEPGDEVVIPAPYWVSYPEQVALVGAVPRIVATHEREGFRLRPEVLAEALGPRTKAVVLCTPSNPTGTAYDRRSLEALVEVLEGHDCWIIVDEIYGELVYDGFEAVSLATIAPQLRERIIVVDGASKSYAMTGWRIGWMLGPAAVAEACEKVQSQATSNPSAVAQQAAIAALRGDRAPLEAMRAEFATRRRRMVEGLAAIPGLRCRMPEGAFYAFASVEGLIGRRSGDRTLDDDLAVAQFFLEDARCAVVPGSAFGAPGFVRLSYATSRAKIDEGLARIAAAVATLR